MGDERGKRKRIVASLVVLLVLFGIVSPMLVRAAGYTISNQSTCDSFLTAIGATGSSTSGTCFINSGTLGSADTLTVGNFMFRPQYVSNPDEVTFTNQGIVTLNDNPSDWSFYGAGKVDNQGTLNINGDSVTYSTLTNSGTMVISAAFTNNGTVNNTGTIQTTCTGSFTNSGTFTGNAVEDLCLLTMTATSSATSTATSTATDTPTSTATSTETDTPTDTPTITPTSTETDTPTTTPTSTITDTPTTTQTSTITPTASTTPTNTPTNTPTDTPTNTPTNTPTDTPTNTPTNTPTQTPTATATPCIAGTPTLLTPADGSKVTGTTVHLDWQDEVCATKYKLVVRLLSQKGHLVLRKKKLTASEYDLTTSQQSVNTYYWRVKACNALGCSKWSAWQSFRVVPETSSQRDDWMFTEETVVAMR